MQDQIIQFITGFVNEHPLIAAFLMAVGTLRVWFKPFTLAIRQMVKQSPWEWDDKLLAKVEAAPIWKPIFWIADYLTSVKILKALVLLGICSIMFGCKSTTFSRTASDGSTMRITDRRCLVNTAASIEAVVTTNGTWNVKASVQSSPEAEAIKAAVAGAAEGITKGLNPIK